MALGMPRAPSRATPRKTERRFDCQSLLDPRSAILFLHSKGLKGVAGPGGSRSSSLSFTSLQAQSGTRLFVPKRGCRITPELEAVFDATAFCQYRPDDDRRQVCPRIPSASLSTFSPRFSTEQEEESTAALAWPSPWAAQAEAATESLPEKEEPTPRTVPIPFGRQPVASCQTSAVVGEGLPFPSRRLRKPRAGAPGGRFSAPISSSRGHSPARQGTPD